MIYRHSGTPRDEWHYEIPKAFERRLEVDMEALLEGRSDYDLT